MKKRITLILTVILAIQPVISAKETDASLCYTKKATFQDTMIATRQQFTVWAASESASPILELGPWNTTGCLKAPKFNTVLFPEKGVDLKAKDGKGKRLWKKQAKWKDGVVQGLTKDIVGSTYLYRTITVKKPTEVTISLGSDDGLAVWLNGKLLLSKDIPRGVQPDQDQVKLDLKEGANHMLLKIYNMRGGHGFYFSTASHPAAGLWNLFAKDFPTETGWLSRDVSRDDLVRWFDDTESIEIERKMIEKAITSVGGAGRILSKNLDNLQKTKVNLHNRDWLDLYCKACTYRENLAGLKMVDVNAIRLAIEDMSKSFGKVYSAPNLEALDNYSKELEGITLAIDRGEEIDPAIIGKLAEKLIAFKRKVLLSNPLLDFDKLLVIRRNIPNAHTAMSRAIGMASLNSHNNTSINEPATAWDNEIVVLSNLRGEIKNDILYKPKGKKLITDVDLHFDAEKLMFSMPGTHDRWNVFEIGIDGKGLRQITPEFEDVDHFDSCYLPDERIIYTSTANFQGLPCEGGSKPMAPLYIMDSNGEGIRQLTFEQDSDWCPTMLNNGRVMYLRWEYSDTPHYFSRILFSMNPDGTTQNEYLGSGSYFPNAYFYARPIPDHTTKVVGIVGGHHGISRSGRLMLFDPAKGRHEADGAVQEIPGRGKKIEPLIIDRLVDGVWPQFLHPYPLSDKYFLVAGKMDPQSLWGIYLVDVFDNMTLVAEAEGTALLEPFPLMKIKRPAIIPDKVDLDRRDAIVYLSDIYQGPGLAGIPKGKVKKLRLFSYHFAHVKVGGHNSVGVESSWDIKRILGTVPVEKDGSAFFRIPANIPISVQPLDEQGRALQLMRSWFVGMPGETMSCVGCHEPQSTVVPSKQTIAALKDAVEIEPWQGEARPFAFKLEMEPLLDKYCVSCHNSKSIASGKKMPDFSNRERAGNFDKTYMALHPYIRRPGPESDIHMLRPMEYYADTSELVQMLKKGHHNVKLAREDWEKLYTWIDLNVPFRGKWAPPEFREVDQDKRRRELAKCYALVDFDPEGEYDAKLAKLESAPSVRPVKPKRLNKRTPPVPTLISWPLDEISVKAKQQAMGAKKGKRIDLGNGVEMKLAFIPAGEFVMGDRQGRTGELSPRRASIDKPFWMGVCEVTNEQFAQFDGTHDSRYIDQQWKDHTLPGYPANLPDQPVIRISWDNAVAFCEWLSDKAGVKVTLPSETQWEWACRAGSDSDFYFGDVDSDFSGYANLADRSIQLLAVTGVNPQSVNNPNEFLDFVPREMRFDDGQKIVCEVGKYKPNGWGLHDMHGNVSEWTLTKCGNYPYDLSVGPVGAGVPDKIVVRGGSWRDRPARATAFYRLAYEPYQRVFNVGFRVVVEAGREELKGRFVTAK